MNRRQFLQRFAAVPIAAALVEPVTRTIFLPPKGGWGLDYSRYLTSNNAWFLKTDFYTHTLCAPADLSEESLERILTHFWRTPFALQPDRLIVSPQTKKQIDDSPELTRIVREMFGSSGI